jgi:hypothetical protein
VTPKRQPTNLAASARARLYNLSREQGKEYQLLLSDFAIERLLYRVGASAFQDRFVLKGAVLFRIWSAGTNRATWDVDLLGRGPNSVTEVISVFKELCGIDVADGIFFDPASLRGESISAADDYVGVRVLLEARLAEARIPVQVDIGFGDALIPDPTWEICPTLLDHPAPRILVYPREAVVAEKLEAMIALGITTSWMKDFYDIHILATRFAFNGQVLSRSIAATLGRRSTPIPADVPRVLTSEFFSAPERQVQWRAFLRRGRLDTNPDADELARLLQRFLVPVLYSLAKEQAFDLT